jgi:hypothetical protein
MVCLVAMTDVTNPVVNIPVRVKKQMASCKDNK